jgi:hypothetical protein
MKIDKFWSLTMIAVSDNLWLPRAYPLMFTSLKSRCTTTKMAKAPKVRSSHQAGNPERKRAKKGKHSKAGTIVAVTDNGR